MDQTTVVDYLIARGVLSVGPASAVTLSGGVSNVVIAVHQDGHHLVVKQSLDKLRVEADWFAPRRRILTEAAAIRVVSTLTPENVPSLVDCDAEAMTLTMLSAPSGWTDWKTRLFAGDIDRRVGRKLGSVLGTWQLATAAGASLTPELTDDPEAFELLRLDPYFGAVARSRPEYAQRLNAAADRLRTTRACLVHGDFSPKNVLVGEEGEGMWVIDFEVAHLGNPVFDVAFLLSHLVMKSIHFSEMRNEYVHTASEFWDAYVTTVASALSVEWDELGIQVGALLMARVEGKSRAEYLDNDERRATWSIGTRLLEQGARTLDDLFDYEKTERR